MSRSSRCLFVVLALSTAGCQTLLGLNENRPPCGGSWWDCEFPHRTTVRFLNQAGSQDLDDIPLAIKLTPDVIDYDQFAPDGSDRHVHGRAGNADGVCDDAQRAIKTVLADQERWFHATLTVDRSQPDRVRVCTELRHLSGDAIARDGGDDCAVTTSLRNSAASGSPVIIGANGDHEQNFFGGLDELRISNGQPDSAWLDAQFLAAMGRFVQVESP